MISIQSYSADNRRKIEKPHLVQTYVPENICKKRKQLSPGKNQPAIRS